MIDMLRYRLWSFQHLYFRRPLCALHIWKCAECHHNDTHPHQE